MTSADFTPKYQRRRLLPIAGLAVSTCVLPSACRILTSSSQDADAFQLATLTGTSPQKVRRVVLVSRDDCVAGIKAVNLLQPQGLFGQTAFLKLKYNIGDRAAAATDTNLPKALWKGIAEERSGENYKICDRSLVAVTCKSDAAKGCVPTSQKI